MSTPLPPETITADPGGGTPNDAELPELGHQNSPASIFPGVSSGGETALVEAVKGLAATLPAEVSAPDPFADVEQVVRWDGRPTKAALRALRLESWATPWDADIAAGVLYAMWDGETLQRACEVVGVRRGVVRIWATLSAEFGGMLDAAEIEAGRKIRDEAVAESDPSRQRSLLAVAASFDRRIKGDAAEGGGSLTVQVVKLG